jgi:hypothetical protein
MEKKIKENALGVVLEDVNGKLGLVLESQSILVKQMKEFREEMTDFRKETNSKFETVFNYLSDNDEMTHKLVGRVDNLEQLQEI